MFFKDSYGYDKTSGGLTDAAMKIVRHQDTANVVKSYITAEAVKDYSASDLAHTYLGNDPKMYTASQLNKAGGLPINLRAMQAASILGNEQANTPIEQANSATFAKTAGIMSTILKKGATWAGSTALMSGIGTAMDEKSRSKHGIMDTFARKIASPKYWALGATSLAVPKASRFLGKWSTKGVGKGVGYVGSKLKNVDGKFSMGTRLSNWGKKLNTLGDDMGKVVDMGAEKAKFISKNIKADKYKDAAMLFDSTGKKVSKMQVSRNIIKSGGSAGGKSRKVALANGKFKTVNPRRATANIKYDRAQKAARGLEKDANAFAKTKNNRFARHVNPFNPMGAVGMTGMVAGVAGPWSFTNSLWDEDSPLFAGMNKSKVMNPLGRNKGEINRFKSI